MKYIKYLLAFFFISFISSAQVKYSKLVDLTYSFDEETIFWPTEEGFKLDVQSFGITEKGFHYAANKFCTAEHGGTHMDAPIHFSGKGQTVDELPIENLIGSAIVIDASGKCLGDRDYQFNVADFLDWEKANGKISKNSIIILKTGYGKYWPDRIKYMGTDERGTLAISKLHFPGLHLDGAKWLVNERNIKAVGIESPSIDFGQSTHFETHVFLAEKNIPVFENVANINELPSTDFYIIALPMKIKNGSGGPARIIGLIP